MSIGVCTCVFSGFEWNQLSTCTIMCVCVCVFSTVASLADNTRIFNEILSQSDAEQLQFDLIIRLTGSFGHCSMRRCSILILYKSLVIPLIEYCCQLWSSWRAGEKQSFEAVQRSFTSRISDIQHLDYWERLKQFNLHSL